MVVVDEVLHADQEHVYSSRPFHREVLGIVPGKMEMKKGFVELNSNDNLFEISNLMIVIECHLISSLMNQIKVLYIKTIL